MGSDQLPDFQRALVITAHPDDAEYGCAGTVALWIRAGVAVTYVICTDGALGIMARYPERIPPEQLTALRRSEQEEAAASLGVEQVEFLDHPDGSLVDDLQLRRELTRSIRRYRPDRIICQNGVRHYADLDSNHPDHLAAGQAAIEAIYPGAHNPYYFPELLEEGLEPHTPREMWILGTETPDLFVDISSVLDRKLAALRCHRSQYRDDPEAVVRATAAAIGSTRGITYAESFRRLSGR